ncbi:MAG: hypothetical protein JNK72_10750 [Myxococcales bacterium]|nr:hypothetical protein [Myxococcales bacterium]
MASHGSGGGARAAEVPLGSVPERLVSTLACALLVIATDGRRAHVATPSLRPGAA